MKNVSVVIMFLFVVMEVMAMSPHPEPVDIPAGPEPADAVGTGGRNLPEIKGAAAPDAPAISMITDVTLPDEALVITGCGLDGARLRLWAEGVVRDMEPLRTANDRLEAVVPKDTPVSTMLVWPVKGEKMGAPIRVNGPVAWWGWPARLTEEEAGQPQTVRVMGKNLSLAGTQPRVYLLGPAVAQWLDAKSANPYCLDAALPAGLKAGRYQVWAHNGTGGRYGWSEPVAFEVVAAPSQKGLKTFRVDDFGARPDDGQDDADAIQAAVDAAASANGGVVAFSAGTYRVGRPIVTPENAGAGIHFVGVGMGTYDPKSQEIGGAHSTLRFADGKPLPKAIVVLRAPFSSLRNLSLVNGNDGMERGINDRGVTGQGVAQAYGQDLRIERVRLVLLDRRPDVPVEQRKNLQLYDAALHILTPGCANILVEDCEFHSAGTGIEVGMLQPGHTDSDPPEPSSDYLRIQGCLFRCYSRGFYKPPADTNARGYATMGARNSGVMNENGKNVIIEACDFAGADRRGGLMMNRSICNYNTSICNVYYANNRSHDVGMVSPREDRVVNQGEQILFHFRYPHGGYFDVIDAGPQHVSVNPQDPRNAGRISSPHHGFDRAGSRVLDEVGTNAHWIVFLSAGKGVGQYRVVVGAERKPDRIVLKLDRPWRVIPDHSSRVTLNTAFRQNIICGNTIDAGFIDPRSKVSGVLFWYNAMENVVAGCTLRHVGYGVGFNASFRNPCAWNLVRDNVMEHAGGMSVECIEPTFYVESCGAAGGANGPLFQVGSDVAGWYAVGNVARSNRGTDAVTAVLVHAAMRDAVAPTLPVQDYAGVIMPVVENNVFRAVKRGIVINRGTIWPVVRNNKIETVEPDGAKVFNQSEPASPKERER